MDTLATGAGPVALAVLVRVVDHRRSIIKGHRCQILQIFGSFAARQLYAFDQDVAESVRRGTDLEDHLSSEGTHAFVLQSLADVKGDGTIVSREIPDHDSVLGTITGLEIDAVFAQPGIAYTL